MQVISKNKKLFVKVPGNPVIEYQIFPNTQRCSCGSKSICNHLVFYYTRNGLEKKYLQIIDVPQIRHFFASKVSMSKINKECKKFMENSPCCICLGGQEISTTYSKCKTCKNITHKKCMERWGKGCPFCKRKPVQ